MPNFKWDVLVPACVFGVTLLHIFFSFDTASLSTVLASFVRTREVLLQSPSAKPPQLSSTVPTFFLYPLPQFFRGNTTPITHTTIQASLAHVTHTLLLHHPARTFDPNEAQIFVIPAFSGDAEPQLIRCHGGGAEEVIRRVRLFSGKNGVSFLERNLGLDHILLSGRGVGWRNDVCQSLWEHKLLTKATKITPEPPGFAWARQTQHNMPLSGDGYLGAPYVTTIHHELCLTKDVAPWRSFGDKKILVGYVHTYPSPTRVHSAMKRDCQEHSVGTNKDKENAEPDGCRMLLIDKEQTASTPTRMELADLFSSSVFCVLPLGDTPSASFIVEAVLLGCIPVVGDEVQMSLWPNHFSWAQDVVFTFDGLVPNGNVAEGSIYDALTRVLPSDLKARQALIAANAHRLYYAVSNLANTPCAANSTWDALSISLRASHARVSLARDESSSVDAETTEFVFVAQKEVDPNANKNHAPTWETYREYCRTRFGSGATLASVHSMRDQLEVCDACSLPSGQAVRECFIGGVFDKQYNPDRRKEEGFEWTDGSPWDFTPRFSMLPTAPEDGTVMTVMDNERYGGVDCRWFARVLRHQSKFDIHGAVCQLHRRRPFSTWSVALVAADDAPKGWGGWNVNLGRPNAACRAHENGFSWRLHLSDNSGADKANAAFAVDLFEDMGCGGAATRVELKCDAESGKGSRIEALPADASLLLPWLLPLGHMSTQCTTNPEPLTSAVSRRTPTPQQHDEILPKCLAPRVDHLGDGYCDPWPYNSPECGYDGGDCCNSTCVPHEYDCGVGDGYLCRPASVPTCRQMAPASQLSVQWVKRRCFRYKADDHPRYHVARLCPDVSTEAGKQDRLAIALANYGFRKCGDFCLFGVTEADGGWKWSREQQCWRPVHPDTSCNGAPEVSEFMKRLRAAHDCNKQISEQSRVDTSVDGENVWPTTPNVLPETVQFMDENLQPFRDVGGISWSMIDRTIRGHSQTQPLCFVDGIWYFYCIPGKSSCDWPDFPHEQKLVHMITSHYHRNIKNLCFVINFYDEPRARPAKAERAARLTSAENIGQVKCNLTGYHDSDVMNMTFWDHEMGHVIDDLVPIWSYTTAPAFGYKDINWLNPNIFHVWERDYKLTYSVPPPTTPAHPDQCIWRGSSTGGNRFFKFREIAPRSTLVHKARDIPGLDAKLVYSIFVGLDNYFRENNMSSSSVPLQQQLRQYNCIVDICGWAWSARFRSLLLSHLAVMKVNSPYTDIFERALRPYEHYIPVCSDMSNLAEAVEWFQQHPVEVAEMAKKTRNMMRQHGNMIATMEWAETLLNKYADLQLFDPRDIDLSEWFTLRLPVVKEGRKVGGG